MAKKQTESPAMTAAATVSTRRWWVLAVMSIGTLMVFIDNTVVNTALPALSIDLGASTSTLQWVIDSYILILAGLLLLGGSLGDRFGRRKWMTIGLVVFGAGAAGAALASSAPMLIVMRGLQGVGAALVLPATLSIITNVFPRAERAKAIAIWTAVGALGVGLGPALGGYLVDQFGWSAAFWLLVPMVALALAGMRIVPESRDQRNLRLDIPGAILGTAGLIALVYGIIQGGDAGWTSPEILGTFGAAVALLGAFSVVELRSSAPMLPLRFFKQKDFTGAVLILGLTFFGMLVTFFFLTQFFQIVQGRSAFEAGLLIVPASLAMMVAATLSGQLIKLVGPRYLVLAMTGAMVTGTLMFTGIDVGTSTAQILLPLVIFGFGVGLGLPALTDTVMAAVPESEAGIGSAVNDVSRELGGALGIAIIGSFVSGLYRSNIDEALTGVLPADVVDLAGESVGVAAIASQNLPADAAATLTEAVNTAFLDAVTGGFKLAAAILLTAVVIALWLIPRRMRPAQAERESVEDPSIVAVPAPAPEEVAA